MSDTSADIMQAALARYKRLARVNAFVPTDPQAVPTPAQAQVIDDLRNDRHRNYWIVAANRAGKTLTAFRILSWLLEESLPGWTRPARWGKGPLMFVVCGRTGKQIEESILPYIEECLDANEYKVVRIGNIVQRLEHKNGNRVVFQSLENPSVARQRLQSFTAHAVFMDEMPEESYLVTEARTRTYTTEGYFFASFTPLVFNLDIKAMVDAAAEPHGKKYQFRMFDNPKITPEMQKVILADMAHLSDAERNARLYGEWVAPSTKVFDYSDEAFMRPLPSSYSPTWNHVRSVDPALSSKLGYVLAANDPNTGFWHIVKACYLEELRDPIRAFDAVLELDKGYNIIRRICDPHETWFTGLAAARGMTHMTPYDKTGRRGELIAATQKMLGSTMFLSPQNRELRSELMGAQWSQAGQDKIHRATKYHQLDALFYLIDCLPPIAAIPPPRDWWTEVRENDKKYKAAQSATARIGRVSRRSRVWM